MGRREMDRSKISEIDEGVSARNVPLSVLSSRHRSTSRVSSINTLGINDLRSNSKDSFLNSPRNFGFNMGNGYSKRINSSRRFYNNERGNLDSSFDSLQKKEPKIPAKFIEKYILQQLIKHTNNGNNFHDFNTLLFKVGSLLNLYQR